MERITVARMVRALIAHRVAIFVVSAVLAVVSGVRTAFTYSHLKSDLEELLPANASSVRALAALRERMPGLKHLGVVVDTGGPDGVAAANRFLDDLAARAKAYPGVEAVRTGIRAEREFAETYALQFMDPNDVQRLRESVERRRDWEVTRALDLDLLDEEEPKIPVEELRKKYLERYGGGNAAGDLFPDDRFVSSDRKTAVLLVQIASSSTGYGSDKELIDRVKADVRALGFPDAYDPKLRMGFAGEVATHVEELSGLEADLALSGVIVIVLVGGVIVWFYRSVWAVPILGLPLLLGALSAFAVVALPPLSIRALNSNTAFLGSIVIGNGVNAGIILLARFQEEKHRGAELANAICRAVDTTWRPTLAASLAAAASYASLVITDFRGFNQFGWIGGIGLVFCWITTYTLGPALMSVWGGKMKRRTAQTRERLSRRAVLGLMARPKRVVIVAGLLTVIGGLGIWHRMGSWMEYDFSRLRRRDSWENGERYWGKRMDETLRRYLTPAVAMADDERGAAVIEQRVRSLKDQGKAGNLISQVASVRDLLRPDREKSVEEARKIRDLLTPRMKQDLRESDRKIVERALSDASLVPLTADKIPSALAAGLRESGGRIDRNVLIYPKISAGTWEVQPMEEFSRDVRDAAVLSGHSYPVAGSLLLSTDIAAALQADGPRATGVALFVVLVVCLLAFGGGRPRNPVGEHTGLPKGAVGLSAAAVGSLFVGVLLMMGVMAWTGERLNFSNFVALPITFGIGADYSINMLRRFQSEGRLDLQGALASTGGAVALCSATTVIGFGSLLVAKNQALFSFGVFAVAGELACLTTAIVALPAALDLLARRREQRVSA